jgi:hypothetical protein
MDKWAYWLEMERVDGTRVEFPFTYTEADKQKLDAHFRAIGRSSELKWHKFELHSGGNDG